MLSNSAIRLAALSAIAIGALTIGNTSDVAAAPCTEAGSLEINLRAVAVPGGKPGTVGSNCIQLNMQPVRQAHLAQ